MIAYARTIDTQSTTFQTFQYSLLSPLAAQKELPGKEVDELQSKPGIKGSTEDREAAPISRWVFALLTFIYMIVERGSHKVQPSCQALTTL